MATRFGPFSDPVTLRNAISRISDEAKCAGRDPPVITTDLFSAMSLGFLIAADWPDSVLTRNRRPGDCVAMFDGVKIMAAMPRKTDNGFREHFGALADIYEAVT